MFFAGDSAGHCLPLTAEGIRTAFYFGIACGRELRAVVEGRQGRAEALARYHAFSASHGKSRSCWRPSTRPPAAPARAGRAVAARVGAVPAHWAFGHYLRIAPPEAALPAPPAAVRAGAAAVAACASRGKPQRAPRCASRAQRDRCI